MAARRMETQLVVFLGNWLVRWLIVDIAICRILIYSQYYLAIAVAVLGIALYFDGGSHFESSVSDQSFPIILIFLYFLKSDFFCSFFFDFILLWIYLASFLIGYLSSSSFFPGPLPFIMDMSCWRDK